MSMGNMCITIILLALWSHAWLRKREPKSLLNLSISLLVIVSLPSYGLVPYVGSPTKAYLLGSAIFLTTLLTSISLYRLSPFHPLSRYPGPWQCRLTKLWGTYIAWNGKPQVYYKKLHDQYGAIVRIGPNELSVIDADLIPNILGASGMPKGPMWGGRRILPSKNWNRNNSLTSVRDLLPWNAAFKPSSVAGYEGMLIARAEQFINNSRTSAILETLHWDRFGGVYSLMRDGDIEQVLLKMRRGVFMPSISQHIPWLLGALHAMPFVSSDTRAFGLFGIEQAKKRASMQNDILRKDLFYYLLEDTKMSVLSKLVSSALLAIVAGSDTTSSNETLRLQPPIPTSLQRAPALGSGGKALSPDMHSCSGSPWIIHRCPRYFSPDPDRFWPDRWLNQRSFPFQRGQLTVQEKPLAMIELRYLTCSLVRTFDMSFDGRYNPAQWEDSLVDRFVMLKGKLPVQLNLRKVNQSL
ncbi:cytochrome P450 [Gymnopilus junonius]|uniref:Cytochrome P450 n=1 Tax=Gymnopilus junonius TaxID=109634 RepID=A0A9P5TP56_GYMJU|nr:cytochrome P450 [Gymnopilus junonius]